MTMIDTSTRTFIKPLDRLIAIREASTLLGLSIKQLRDLDNSGKLRAVKTEGKHRRYLLSDIHARMGIPATGLIEQLPIAVYCRVSSHDQKQKGDLDRQKLRLLEHCAKNNPTSRIACILDEVGSGMNDARPKLHQLLKLVFERKINKVIIEHKDRLSRFNYKIFKVFFESHGVTIECLEERLPKSFEDELVDDMLTLMASFSSKIYGKRGAANRKKVTEATCVNTLAAQEHLNKMKEKIS